MTIKLIGKDVPIQRIETGFWSFDNACMNQMGERGFAVPAFVELYADEGIGKTAFAATMGGIIARNMQKDIAFLDWELQDFKTIITILENQKFSGTLYKILEKKDEESLDKFYDIMEKESYGVGIMDSIAAFRSIAEANGNQGDANMGKRGFNMSQFSRTTIRNMQFRKTPAAVFCTNHMHPKIGFMQQGSDTAGGVTKKYMATYRFWLRKFYWKEKKMTLNIPPRAEFPMGWVIEGRLDKNRTGYAFRKFYTVMIMGEGLSQNLTALYECLIYNQATLERNIVTMDDMEYGHIKDLVAKRHEDALFDQFRNKLKSLSSETEVEEDEPEYVQDEVAEEDSE